MHKTQKSAKEEIRAQLAAGCSIFGHAGGNGTFHPAMVQSDEHPSEVTEDFHLWHGVLAGTLKSLCQCVIIRQLHPRDLQDVF